jgi:hypothetical protein
MKQERLGAITDFVKITEIGFSPRGYWVGSIPGTNIRFVQKPGETGITSYIEGHDQIGELKFQTPDTIVELGYPCPNCLPQNQTPLWRSFTQKSAVSFKKKLKDTENT